jgi:hypothetical protein
MSIKFLGPTMAVVVVTGLGADAAAKARNPLGDDKHDAFVLQTTTTSTGPVAVLEVQNAITGDVVVGAPRSRVDGRLVRLIGSTDVSGGCALGHLRQTLSVIMPGLLALMRPGTGRSSTGPSRSRP